VLEPEVTCPKDTCAAKIIAAAVPKVTNLFAIKLLFKINIYFNVNAPRNHAKKVLG
jgi:hypothetical protein